MRMYFILILADCPCEHFDCDLIPLPIPDVKNTSILILYSRNIEDQIVLNSDGGELEFKFSRLNHIIDANSD